MLPTIVGLCIVLVCLLGIIGMSAHKLVQLKQTEKQLQDHIEQIRYEEQERDRDLEIVRGILEKKEEQVTHLETRKRELNDDIATQVSNVEKLKVSFETTEEEFKKKYLAERKLWMDERQEEYVRMQEDFVEQFREENKRKLFAAQELSEKLDDLRSEAAAAIEVAKRHAEEENFIEFHSLQLESSALNDIKRLEELVPNISPEAGEAIAKVIWKVYYEKPYTDLVGRTIGSGRHTGIYRITNNNTQMCYIGQAVDIADRWRQHIKRALNAEPRTQNKLYPAMYKEGLENFTFEIVEECEQSKLNAREDYWQDFYKAKEYGYSIK